MRQADTTGHRAENGSVKRTTSWTYKVLVVTLAVAVVGSTALGLVTRSNADYAFFDALIDVRTIISNYAVDPPDEAELQRAAIEGMVAELDDPYAVYVPQQASDDFNKGLTGEYVGIGAEVNLRGGYLHIVTPLDGSPAFKAGLMAGDDVIQIDGESTEGKTTDESIALLKGEPGDPVELLIDRDGERLTITVVRDHIRTPAVKGYHRDRDENWEYVIDDERGIAYIRLAQFTPTSAESLLEAIGSAEQEAGGSLGGLILDLRFNPGGVLDQAVAMADFFLRGGVVVSTRGPAHPEEIFEARDQTTDRDWPIALLINGQSASASEVLAGALTENDRAIAVGTRTFGKGSVQSVRGLTGAAAGAVLKLTEQRYYLPSGRSIQRTDGAAEWGVDPTPGHFVAMTDEETLAMVRAAREQELIGARDDDPGDWTTPDAILETLKDPQLASAMRAIQTRVDSGSWASDGADMPDLDPAIVEELSNLKLARERVLRQQQQIDRRIATLEDAAENPDAVARAERQIDLFSDDAEIAGGELVIRAANGEEVARLRITGDNLERWLLDAGVEPIAAGDGAGGDSEQ